MPVVISERTGPGHGTEHAALGRIARTGALFMSANVARGAAGLAMSIVIARYLGQETFGRWTLCMAWASLLTFLLDLGFGVMLTRDAAADRAGAGQLLAGALAARSVLFVPAAILFVAAASWLGLQGEPATVLVAMIVLAATGIAYGSIAAVCRAWPETVSTIVSVEIAGAALLLGGTWQIAQQGGDVTSLLALASAVQAAQLVGAALVWRVAAGTANGLSLPSVGSTVALLRRAFPFAVSGFVANLQERLGPLALGWMSGVAEVAMFGAAWRIGTAARLLPQSALGGGLPVLAEEASSGRLEAVKRRFERLLALFAAGAAATMALFAVPLVRLTYGDAFAPAAPTLVWVALGLWPFVVNSARKVGLYAAGQETMAVRFSVITLVVQTAACIALIPRLGAPGAALAMAAGEAVVWWPLRSYARATS